MGKYVNADNLIEEFRSVHPDSQLMYASAFAEFVKDAPSEDVIPVVHARWVLVRKMMDGGFANAQIAKSKSISIVLIGIHRINFVIIAVR